MINMFKLRLMFFILIGLRVFKIPKSKLLRYQRKEGFDLKDVMDRFYLRDAFVLHLASLGYLDRRLLTEKEVVREASANPKYLVSYIDRYKRKDSIFLLNLLGLVDKATLMSLLVNDLDWFQNKVTGLDIECLRKVLYDVVNEMSSGYGYTESDVAKVTEVLDNLFR